MEIFKCVQSIYKIGGINDIIIFFTWTTTINNINIRFVNFYYYV